jgi:Flp pilus assembly protein TadD
MSGDSDGAIDALKKAAEISEGDAGVWFNLARTYRGAGRYDEAEEACKKGLALEPESPSGLLLIASLELNRGATEEARARILGVLARDPANREALRLQALLREP